MPNIIVDAWNTYVENIRLVLLFSIPFMIALLIPLLAPLPTYITSGAIFLRSASIFVNISALGMAVLVAATLFSLLFLSFAFVAISLIVKAARTHTKHTRKVLEGIELYTGRVFMVLVLYAFVLTIVNVLSYYSNTQEITTPVVGFLLFFAVFYAPAAIVLDNRKVVPALVQSARMVVKNPAYFLLWIVLVAIVLTVLDFIAIGIFGTLASRYVLLAVNALFVLPYFVILQAEAYMRRYALLKH